MVELEAVETIEKMVVEGIWTATPRTDFGGFPGPKHVQSP